MVRDYGVARLDCNDVAYSCSVKAVSWNLTDLPWSGCCCFEYLVKASLSLRLAPQSSSIDAIESTTSWMRA